MSYTNQTTSTAPASKNGPLLPSEVDFSKFAYSELKQMGNGPAKTCYVNYNGGKLVIETPWMTTPFGIRQPPIEFRDEGAPPKYSIEFTLKGYAGEDPAVQALYDFMQNLQEMSWHRDNEVIEYMPIVLGVFN